MKCHHHVLLAPIITQPKFAVPFSLHRRELKIRRDISDLQCHCTPLHSRPTRRLYFASVLRGGRGHASSVDCTPQNSHSCNNLMEPAKLVLPGWHYYRRSHSTSRIS